MTINNVYEWIKMNNKKLIILFMMIIMVLFTTGCLEYLQKYNEFQHDIQTMYNNRLGKEEENLLNNVDKDIDQLNMSSEGKLICKEMARSIIFEEKRKDIELFTHIEEEKMCRDILDNIPKKI